MHTDASLHNIRHPSKSRPFPGFLPAFQHVVVQQYHMKILSLWKCFNKRHHRECISMGAAGAGSCRSLGHHLLHLQIFRLLVLKPADFEAWSLFYRTDCALRSKFLTHALLVFMNHTKKGSTCWSRQSMTSWSRQFSMTSSGRQFVTDLRGHCSMNSSSRQFLRHD